MGFCQNVRLTNATCLDDFVTVPDDIQENFCSLLTETYAMPQFNQYIDAYGYLNYLNENIETCPQLYMPYPSSIITAFEGSGDDDFCVAPV